MKNNEFVQRIKECYVTTNCMQVMFLKDGDAITILDSDGILYHQKDGSDFFVNKALEKRGNNRFPYSNIPYYKTRNGEYINQVIDFDRIYLQIGNGYIIETYAVKDGEEALVANKLLLPTNKRIEVCNRDKVLEIYQKNKDNIYVLDGSKRVLMPDFLDEDKTLEEYKDYIRTIRNLEEKVLESRLGGEYEYREYSERFGLLRHSSSQMKFMRDAINKAIDSITLDDIAPINLEKNNIFITKGKNDIDSITGINVRCFGKDIYQLEMYDYPLTKYTYEHIKQLEATNSIKSKEPKIKTKFNPNIDKEEVEKSKEWVKSLKRR